MSSKLVGVKPDLCRLLAPTLGLGLLGFAFVFFSVRGGSLRSYVARSRVAIFRFGCVCRSICSVFDGDLLANNRLKLLRSVRLADVLEAQIAHAVAGVCQGHLGDFTIARGLDLHLTFEAG
jgi:hypothetical protein